MASAVIGSLRVVLGIDTAIFDKGLGGAMKSLKGIGKSMQKVGAGMSAAITAPIVGFGVSVVRTAGDFEAAMNRVGAATGASGDELSAMSVLARHLGKDTTKSASESADMLEMLAKNGLSAKQILEGAAASAISLSEATGGDLSRSADVATNVMAQFNLEVKDLPRIVDQITASTLDSQFGFDDYALALGQAGGVAGGLGVSLEDFNTVITATSDTFNSGSDAGTSFKTFLLSLTPTTSKARAAMENLGLEFFDAQGKMKSMAEIAEELRTSMAGLSDTEMSANMKTIFGTDSMRTAIALMNQGAEGLNKVQEGINRQGVAAEQQAARMKGFNGEMEKMSGAFEELQLSIASSGLLSSITSMVTKIAEFVEGLAKTSPEILKWGTVVAGLAAVLGPVVLVLGTLAVGIAAIGLPIAAVIAAVAGLTAVWVLFREDIAAVDQALMRWARNFDAGVVSLFNTGVEKIKAFASSLIDVFAALPGQMVDIGAQILQGLWNGLKSKMGAVKDSLTGYATGLVDSVKSTLGIQSPSRVMHEVGTNIMQGLGLGMEAQKGYVIGVAKSTADQAVSTTKDAWAGLREVSKDTSDSFGSMFQSVGSSIGEAIKGTKKWSDVLEDVLGQLAQVALSKMNIGGGVGGGGGFGGLISGLFGSLLGFANGGSFQVGGSGGIDSQVVAFRASPTERVSITKPGQEGGGRSIYAPVYHIDARGADQAAIARIERGLDQRDRTFDRRVDHRNDTRQTRKTRG
ncbi:phage tail tape measure protein [Mesorhizobium sp. A623]